MDSAEALRSRAPEDPDSVRFINVLNHPTSNFQEPDFTCRTGQGAPKLLPVLKYSNDLGLRSDNDGCVCSGPFAYCLLLFASAEVL